MPDTSVKVYRGNLPDETEIDRLQVGQRLVWLPSPEQVKWGCQPTLYTVRRLKKGRTVLWPEWPIPHALYG